MSFLSVLVHLRFSEIFIVTMLFLWALDCFFVYIFGLVDIIMLLLLLFFLLQLFNKLNRVRNLITNWLRIVWNDYLISMIVLLLELNSWKQSKRGRLVRNIIFINFCKFLIVAMMRTMILYFIILCIQKLVNQRRNLVWLNFIDLILKLFRFVIIFLFCCCLHLSFQLHYLVLQVCDITIHLWLEATR